MMNPTSFPTLGILGAGQLGRMTALAAMRLGVHVRLLSNTSGHASAGLANLTVGDWSDPEVLGAFAEGCDVVTCESEWAPVSKLATLRPGLAVRPGPRTLEIIRDKGVQKKVLADAGLPIPAFALCATADDAHARAMRFGYPVVLKRRRGSYDGYGNATVHDETSLRAAWSRLAQDDGLLVEEFATFSRELATLVARRPGGEHVVYPVVYTEQRDHRCHAVVAPSGLPLAVEDEAKHMALAAVEAVGGIGITGVELFEMPDGSLLVNELAPRPHNTGHYSIEGCHTSQFENHVRAVLDWPLGSPDLRVPAAVMINILGHREGQPRAEGLRDALNQPCVSVHVYNKPDVRSRRKMGHVTATGIDPVAARKDAERAAQAIQL